MSNISAFFRLIRLPNLLIIALTQYLIRYCIIIPMAARSNFESQISDGEFFLIVLSTVMIAAAGYIINDYFDIKIDQINKPDKIIVGRKIKRRIAMGAHTVINILALAIAGYISYRLGIWKMIFIFIFGAVSLWYYATQFKRQFLVGNLIIAVMAALIPLIIGLFEIPLMTWEYFDILKKHNANLNFIAWWVMAYAGFAFFLTLAREIKKDIVDIKGDKMFGCETMPIKIGVVRSKWIISIIYIAVLVAVVYLQQMYLPDTLSFLYILFAFGIVFLLTFFKTIKARTKKEFHTAATLNKLLSVVGILYALIVKYILTGN